jgi:hypothetical protein
MSDDALDAMVAAATSLLDIPLDPAWHAGVRAHLAVSLRMGADAAAFPLPDETEPAPVFTP